MKKLIILGALAAAFTFSNSAEASASYGYCATGTSPYTSTNGGYSVTLDQYRGQGMNCASVRYVANKWLRRKIARQYGWPRLGGAFYDGYVTWHCWKRTSLQWQCDEFTSHTSFRFRGRVR